MIRIAFPHFTFCVVSVSENTLFQAIYRVQGIEVKKEPVSFKSKSGKRFPKLYLQNYDSLNYHRDIK